VLLVVLQLSYHVYLLHMVALYWGEALLLPRGYIAATVRATPVHGYFLILGFTCACAYVTAAAHHWAHQVGARGWRTRRGTRGAIDVKPKYS
jgi:hypothetical protein